MAEPVPVRVRRAALRAQDRLQPGQLGEGPGRGDESPAQNPIEVRPARVHDLQLGGGDLDRTVFHGEHPFPQGEDQGVGGVPPRLATGRARAEAAETDPTVKKLVALVVFLSVLVVVLLVAVIVLATK